MNDKIKYHLMLMPVLLLLTSLVSPNVKIEAIGIIIIGILSILILRYAVILNDISFSQSLVLSLINLFIILIPIVIYFAINKEIDGILYLLIETIGIPFILLCFYLFYYKKHGEKYLLGIYSIHSIIPIIIGIVIQIIFIYNISNILSANNKIISIFRLIILIQLGIVIILELFITLINFLKKSFLKSSSKYSANN
jgi:hypothetical protein